jgi:hypothetical protein
MDYGEMYVFNNSTSQTLTTQNTWYVITAFDTIGDSNNVTVDPVTDNDLTVSANGVYLVTVSLSFSGGANQTYEFAIHVDGAIQNDLYASRKLNAAGDVGPITLSGLLDLTASEAVDLRVRCTSAAATAVTAEEANVSLYRFTRAFGGDITGPTGTTNAGFSFNIGDGSSAIPTGHVGMVEVPADCTIQRAALAAYEATGMRVDVLRATAGDLPLTTGHAITDTALNLTGVGYRFRNTGLTGWTTSLSDTDYVGFIVLSNSGVTLCTISLKVSV